MSVKSYEEIRLPPRTKRKKKSLQAVVECGVSYQGDFGICVFLYLQSPVNWRYFCRFFFFFFSFSLLSQSQDSQFNSLC